MSHIKRMVEERRELERKTSLLEQFIYTNDTFKTLPEIERVEMCKQLGVMQHYVKILDGRIWRAKR